MDFHLTIKTPLLVLFDIMGSPYCFLRTKELLLIDITHTTSYYKRPAWDTYAPPYYKIN